MSNEKVLDQHYWEAQYKTNATGWDLGKVSPPIKEYIDTLDDKNSSILIPGCGNSHEAEYLLSQGFTNITLIDIAPTLVENLQEKFKNYPHIKIVLGDFFEHKGQYDLVIEQTFFCALPPTMREKYVVEIHKILKDKGLLVGLLFNKTFESGPPFGGSKAEYEQLFKNYFDLKILETCHNSIAPRANSELFIEFQKKDLK
jgi:SAM-dependent methyltransferase